MLDEYIQQTGITYFGNIRMHADEKKKAVIEHFNRVAPTYDFMNSVLSFGIHHAWKREAVRMLRLTPGSRVIDVCGGTGDLSVLAAYSVGAAGRIVLCDLNAAMIQIGRNRRRNRQAAERIHYVQGDAEHIPFPDDVFNAALVGFGIRNVTHLKAAFAEMHRVLAPGGRLMCLEFSRPRSPVFRKIYDWYSFHLMPILGQILVGSGRSYSCLSETIRMFATAEELKTILENIGFQSVFFKHFTNGVAVVHIARK